MAVFNGFFEIVKIFIGAGGVVGWRDRTGATVLHASMHSASCETVHYLLHCVKKGDPQTHIIFSVDDEAQTVLHYAARFGAPLTIIRLIQELEQSLQQQMKTKGASRSLKSLINAVDRWGRTSLHWAALNGFATVVTELLNYPGIDVTIKDAENETALDMSERKARCGANERGGAGRPSQWSGIAKILGGSGTTEAIRERLKKGRA